MLLERVVNDSLEGAYSAFERIGTSNLPHTAAIA
jgi:hypothetical protein